MNLTGSVRYVVLLVCITLFSTTISVSAIQQNSKEETNSLAEIEDQHCPENLNSCYRLPYLLLLYNSTLKDNLTKIDAEGNLADACCQTKEQNSGLFTLEYILEGYTLNPIEEENWSVLSELSDPLTDDNSVQSEIDLTEVEELEPGTEEAEKAGIDEVAGSEDDLNSDKTPNAEKPYFLIPEYLASEASEDPASMIHVSPLAIRFDWFAQLNRSFCLNDLYTIGIDDKDAYPVSDIPIYTNKKIEAFIHLYTRKKRDVFVKALERLPKYQPMFSSIFSEHELPLNLVYLAVVESNLNPNARSRANAVGLWQFMSYTGKHFGLSRSWWHDDRFDPERSTEAAANYLKRLYSQFNGNWELAMAAYNSGSGTVRRAIRRAKSRGKTVDFWSLRLPRETRGYVPAFYAVATIFSNLEKYGFKALDPTTAIVEKRHLDVGGGISLQQLADLFDLEHSQLSDMNPRLRLRGLTPPTYDSFTIALPASLEITQDDLAEINRMKENRDEIWKIHKVRQGETLWSISRFYKIPMDKILSYNRLRDKRLLRIGQSLMLPVPSEWNPPKSPSKTQLAVSDIDKVPGVTKIHVVQKGETLWQISQKYNISIEKIRHWNRRVLGRKYLKIGTEIVLKIPLSVASNSPN